MGCGASQAVYAVRTGTVANPKRVARGAVTPTAPGDLGFAVKPDLRWNTRPALERQTCAGTPDLRWNARPALERQTCAGKPDCPYWTDPLASNTHNDIEALNRRPADAAG